MKKTILKSNKLALSLFLSILFVFGFAGKTNAMMLSTSDFAKLLIAVDQQQGGVTSEQAFALGSLISSGGSNIAVQGPGGMPLGNIPRNTTTTTSTNSAPTPLLINRTTSSSSIINPGPGGMPLNDQFLKNQNPLLLSDTSVSSTTDTSTLSSEDQAVLDFAKSYVTSVQSDLISKGYLTGSPTGFFDPNTKSAIDNLKIDNKVEKTDISGTKTLTLISDLSNLKPAQKHFSLPIDKSISTIGQNLDNKPLLNTNLNSLKAVGTPVSYGIQPNIPAISTAKLGDTGANVSNIQAVLVNKGLLSSTAATGIFDKTTQTAISTLQTQNGLSAVGVAGPQTTQLINNMVSATPALLTAPTTSVGSMTTSRALMNALPLPPTTSNMNRNTNINSQTSGGIQSTSGSSVQ